VIARPLPRDHVLETRLRGAQAEGDVPSPSPLEEEIFRTRIVAGSYSSLLTSLRLPRIRSWIGVELPASNVSGWDGSVSPAAMKGTLSIRT
jgi:hypothetical protein